MRRRPTGFAPKVREIIRQRAQNRCEICGEHTSDLQIHHRRPRGMGGSRRSDTNTASAGLLLCLMDHHRIESHRTQAYDDGHLVRSGQSPLATPVLYRGQWSLLDDLGYVYRIPAPVGGVAS